MSESFARTPEGWSTTMPVPVPDGVLGERTLGGSSPGTSAPDSSPESALTGDQRNVYDAILATLRQYGLESLAGTLLRFIQNGYSESTITVLLQDTPEYKQRFAANEARRKKGLPVLSPAEYLATERAYREVMSAAGMPVGFYDDPSDFTKWLEDDVSPMEVNQRVAVARQLIDTLDPNVRAAFENWYTTGDMVAYALDRDRATTVLERQYRAAQVGGAAAAQGVGVVDRGLAERIAETGVTPDQASSGFAAVAQIAPQASRLAGVYGGDYDERDAVDEVFFASADATERRRGLASRERAQFRGSSNTTAASLTSRSAGQV